MTEPTRDQAEPGDRAIELSIEVPGSPEEVWEAIATGPGVTSWFIPFEIEGRQGGRVVMDFGAFGAEEASVSAWEPPHRFEYRGGGEHPLAYEWLVEARDGGSCIVRLVNSGFGQGEDWDGEYDGMSEGWRIFLESLRLQLTHHRGRRGRAVIPTVNLPGPNRAAWSALCAALGIPDDRAAGDAVRTPDGVPRLAGQVDTVLSTGAATTYLLVLDEPAPGTGFISVEGDGPQAAGSVYLYLYGDEARAGAEWAAWLTARVPAMTEPLSAEAHPTSGQ